MTKYLRPGMLASILAGIVCGLGCNPLALPSFLGPEPCAPPELQAIKVADKKRPVNVVILTYDGQDLREEFALVDRQLSELVKKQMQSLEEYSGTKYTFVSLRKVEEYKSTHPQWAVDVARVGHDLGADFVIYLEIHSMSLYEKGANRQLFHGQTEISVSLHRVDDEDSIPERKEYHGGYPNTRGFIPVDQETSPVDFREQFLTYVARRIAWFFMPHPTHDTYMDDTPSGNF